MCVCLLTDVCCLNNVCLYNKIFEDIGAGVVKQRSFMFPYVYFRYILFLCLFPTKPGKELKYILLISNVLELN